MQDYAKSGMHLARHCVSPPILQVTPDLRHALLAHSKSRKRVDLRVSLVDDGLFFFSFAKNGDRLEPPRFSSLENVDLSALIEDVKGIVQLAVELSRLSPGRASA